MRDHRQVLIVAGEASADLHGANLVRAMRPLCPGLRVCGVGGENMREAGVKILVPSSDMAVVGLTEVLERFRTIFRAARRLKEILKTRHPDLLILMDYPDFNIHMARTARRLGVPVLYYISPQVWAWRRGRVKKIARRVNRMAVILPFEEDFYRERGVSVDYVGHPLLDAFESSGYGGRSGSVRQDRHRTRTGPAETQGPVVGLVPGSRREEIRSMLPVMLRAVEILKTRYPHIRCVLPLARTLTPRFLDPFMAGSSLDIEVRRGDIYGALDQCRVALVTSGTATLDTAIMEVPMVIVYRVTPLSYRVGKILIKTSFIGLANLVAGERVAPELIQHEVTPERLASEALRLIEDGDLRERTIGKLRRIKDLLGKGGASERTARIAAEMMRC
ncbi:MAG TPA: lipid-A-disaccharide synthase [Deltaproteobacteria bacterium]|nr:lipid-A-disaccharide synthase [Deltaproteobacteria bacterium]